MAKGVRFIGGTLDGVVLTIMCPPKKFFSQMGLYYSQKEPKGDVSIMRGDFSKDKDWIYCGVELYLKFKNSIEGTIYKFSEVTVKHRCVAITKKGTRCLREALENKTYCSSVHK